METTIWHNPRCSKSRQTLALLQEHGVEPEVRFYLDEPPTRQELTFVLEQLGFEPRQLMRSKEALYKELGLRDESDDSALLEAMVNNPRLIERPVVIRGEKVALGRPPENVLSVVAP